jgi:hypothetical protein
VPQQGGFDLVQRGAGNLQRRSGHAASHREALGRSDRDANVGEGERGPGLRRAGRGSARVGAGAGLRGIWRARPVGATLTGERGADK